MSVNVITDSRTIRTEPAIFRSSCYPDIGIVGAKAGIITGPSDEILTIIGEMEIEQGMPHPILEGEWGKISKEAKKSYLFLFPESPQAYEVSVETRPLPGAPPLFPHISLIRENSGQQLHQSMHRPGNHIPSF